MKNIVLLILSFMLLSATAFAEQAGAPNNAPISAEDSAKLKEQLSALSKAMGNPVTTPPPVPSATPTEKTITQVADKALDMVGNAVATLSSSLSKIAPQVWRIMIKQQYAKAIGNIATSFTLLICIFIYIIVIRKFWNSELDRNSDGSLTDGGGFKYAFRSVVPVAVACAVAGIFAFQLGDSIKLLVNPEYYAVKDILLLITNPTQAPD